MLFCFTPRRATFEDGGLDGRSDWEQRQRTDSRQLQRRDGGERPRSHFYSQSPSVSVSEPCHRLNSVSPSSASSTPRRTGPCSRISPGRLVPSLRQLFPLRPLSTPADPSYQFTGKTMPSSPLSPNISPKSQRIHRLSPKNNSNLPPPKPSGARSLRNSKRASTTTTSVPSFAAIVERITRKRIPFSVRGIYFRSWTLELTCFSIAALRIQFLAIEIARNRLGLNDFVHEQYQEAKRANVAAALA